MLAVEPKTGTHTQPVARWRNYYRVYHVLHLSRVGHWFPGINAGPDDFPSKDVAETYARAFLVDFNPPGRVFMEYAGAFREDGRAN